MANVASLASAALTAGNGMLRLALTWVPRSFLQPGRRLKLHPDDYYALGMHCGGIDERWFGSTTEAANDGARILWKDANELAKIFAAIHRNSKSVN